MKDILQNCLFTPGTKLTVKDRIKHRSIAPGSTCFMGRLVGTVGPSPNMVSFEIIMTKNGKRGKDRVSHLGVVTTVFPIEFEKRPLKSNKYKRMPVAELEAVPIDIANVTNLNPMDFIGWACAYKAYIRGLYNNAHIIDKWPKGKGQPVNGFRHIESRMQKFPGETIDMLSAPDFRLAFVEQLRGLEAAIIQFVLERKAQDMGTLLRGLAYLVWTDEKYKKNFYDLKQLKKNYGYYRAVLEAEQNLSHQISMKRWSSLPARKRKDLPKPSNPIRPATIRDVVETVKYVVKNDVSPPFHRIVFPDGKARPGGHWKHLGGEVFEIQEA